MVKLRPLHYVVACAAMLSTAASNTLGVENQITSTQGFQIVARLTGASSINRTNIAGIGIGGTDLGHMVNHNGKTYFLFGDTFSSDTPNPGTGWRHNTMAWSTDTTPANGITFNNWVRNGTQATQVITNGAGNPITEIPTGAISVNGKIYAWYMGVNHWGDAGDWTLSNVGLSKWKEGDASFANVNNFSFAPGGNFGMVAASQRSPLENTNDDNVYVWGTPSGRYGGVALARVAPSDIENRSAYEFFDGNVNGSPTWTANEASADLIVNNSVGEMSVMYNPAVGQWTMMYFNEVNDTFELRQSPTPWGTWSNPVQVATSAQAPGGLYAPYMNPLYVENNGKTIYFTMSLWNTYDVYLAKTTLNLTQIPEPSSAAGLIILSIPFLRRRKQNRHGRAIAN